MFYYNLIWVILLLKREKNRLSEKIDRRIQSSITESEFNKLSDKIAEEEEKTMIEITISVYIRKIIRKFLAE